MQKLILHLTAEIPNFLYLDGDCFEHQSHLSVLSGLGLTDDALKRHGRPFKYYSTIAIFSACARELSSEVFRVWNELYGAVDANKFAKTLVPKSSSGRWGCVDGIERRLLNPPFHQWVSCMTRVILKKLNLSESELNSFKGLLPNDVLNLFLMSSTVKKPKGGAWNDCAPCKEVLWFAWLMLPKKTLLVMR